MSKHEKITINDLHNKKLRPYCDKCGSADIRSEAFVEWSERLQDWHIVELLDGNQVCCRCGQDCSVKWRITD